MRIAFVSARHHESLVDLMCELHAHYHQPSEITRKVVRAHLLENLLAVDSPLRLVVASRENRGVVGFAAIALLYSLVEPTPDKHRQCLLKELFVRSSERGQGVGKALMAWIARYAVNKGCCRIDWPVQASNDNGISLYESLGAKRVAERLSYRLSGSSLLQLAGAGDGWLAG